MSPQLFDQFLKNGLYFRGWSPKTVVVYQRAWDSYARFQQSLRSIGESNPTEALPVASTLTKAQLEAWIVSRREAGMSPAGINIYVRSLNSFFSWLKEEGHVPEALVLKQIKHSAKPVTVFSAEDIRAIVLYRPTTFYDYRMLVILQVLLDTGCRIDEILSIPENRVDLDNLLLSVIGKGSKPRQVPFSFELRKVLWKYRQTVGKRNQDIPSPLFFATRTGQKLTYRNILRDIMALCKKIGITKRVHPHLTRHTFACHFMKNGGSIYTLSRLLGHSSVSTTQTYIRGLGVEDFKEEHSRMSPIARAR